MTELAIFGLGVFLGILVGGLVVLVLVSVSAMNGMRR